MTKRQAVARARRWLRAHRGGLIFVHLETCQPDARCLPRRMVVRVR